MGSIENHPPAASAAGHLATIEKYQKLFAARLQGERTRFVTLNAALSRAEQSPAGIFDELTFNAHRLKGAAATFEFAGLAAAADALEHASAVATRSHAPHADTAVRSALEALVHMLGDLAAPAD